MAGVHHFHWLPFRFFAHASRISSPSRTWQKSLATPSAVAIFSNLSSLIRASQTRAAKPQIKPVYQLLTIPNQIMLPRACSAVSRMPDALLPATTSTPITSSVPFAVSLLIYFWLKGKVRFAVQAFAMASPRSLPPPSRALAQARSFIRKPIPTDGNLPIWPATDSQRFAWIVPSHSKQGCRSMAVSTWLAQRNEKARARLMRNLPEVFPGGDRTA
jgi:hypothetical protein